MRLQSLTNKKIPPPLILLFMALVIFGMGVPHAAHAQNVITDPIGFAISVAGYIAEGAAYVVQRILIILLFIEGFIIDNLFIFNIVLNPMNMPAVIGAWKILRDIANSLFLLILLYLAIQTIWGLGDNKKILVRLIIMAFLINFSLAITGAVFGFANALAKPFNDKMGFDVAGFIIDKTKLNTVMNVPSDPKKIEKPATCLLGELTNSTIPIKCPEKSFGTDTMNVLSGAGSAIANKALNNDQMKNAMGMWIANVFLILTILTFGGVGGFLVVRIAMMAFLGVLSPAAFFLYATPWGESLFIRWRKNLIGWAFIAPTFYFLFYVSLLVLDAMTKSPLTQNSDKIPFFANVFAMIPLVVFLVFLGATLKVCKNLGGEVADTAIKMGKMAGGLALTAAAGIATGGASLALGGVARVAGTTAPALLDKLESRPILRTLAKPITMPISARYQKKNDKIDAIKEKYAGRSSNSLLGEMKSVQLPSRRLAISEILQGRDDGSYDKMSKGTQDTLANYATRSGRTEHLKARLDLANKKNVPDASDDYEAKKKVTNKMTPKEKSKISKYALEDHDTKKAILETATLADIKEIIRTNAEMTQTLFFEFFEQNQTMLRGIMKQETLNYIDSTMRIQARGTRPAPAAPAAGAPATPATPPVTPPVTPPATPGTTP